MAHANHWSTISGEMIHCTPSKSKQEIAERVKSEEVLKLGKELLETIRGVRGLENIKPPRNSTPYWSLLTSTSWRVSNPKLDQIKTICAVALEETEPAVLQARTRLLSFKHTMDLRFDIWLTINLWLKWNATSLPGATRSFNYWDKCPDQTVNRQGVYLGETAEKVSQLMARDVQALKELGDGLASSPAMTNNRDDPSQRRAISLEAKSIIDTVLEVSHGFDGFLKLSEPSTLRQFAANRMDSQRMLRFPPSPEYEDQPNPFSKLPPYRYSQLAFNSFSEEDIKNQAGRRSVPSVGLREGENYNDPGLSVRDRKGNY
jgi:uncharacterized protein (UPF0254 family)